MGRGSYQARDWARLRSSRNLTPKYSEKKIFTSGSAPAQYTSKFVTVRESRDSEDSPRSTPIIIGFDVTASMGYLASELACNAVNKTVTELCSTKPIPDPHVLCAAIGDSRCDAFPLQVTQFEADIRIIKQLIALYLEGGGGGNGGESYNLLWYFAAFHTVTDCAEKRNEKGFLFTIGDDACHPQLSADEIRRAFGDNAEYSYSNEELIRLAGKKYEIFHIHIETDSSFSSGVFARWQELLPGRTAIIHKRDIGCLSSLITAVIRGTASHDANAALKTLDQDEAEKIARSVSVLNFDKPKKADTIIF